MASHARNFLIMEMKTVTRVKLVGERIFHEGIDDLLGMAIGITSNEKSINGEISYGEIDDWDES